MTLQVSLLLVCQRRRSTFAIEHFRFRDDHDQGDAEVCCGQRPFPHWNVVDDIVYFAGFSLNFVAVVTALAVFAFVVRTLSLRIALSAPPWPAMTTFCNAAPNVLA